MRNTFTFIASLALAVSLGFSAAHAADLTGSVSGAGSAVGSGSAGSGTSGAASSDDSTSVDVDDDSSSAGAGSRADASAPGTGAADAGAAISVSYTRDDLSADESAVDAAMSASSVVSPGDLSRFVAASFKQDNDLESIDATNDHVAVAYRVPARLLGFIPASLTALATVSKDGTVTVAYPWYRFLFSVPNAVDQADLQASLQGTLLANANGTFDAMTEARIIQLIRDAFSDASTGTESQAQSSGSTATDTADDAPSADGAASDASETGGAGASGSGAGDASASAGY